MELYHSVCIGIRAGEEIMAKIKNPSEEDEGASKQNSEVENLRK